MQLLNSLGISAINPGAYDGKKWLPPSSKEQLESINPTNEKVIATVHKATEKDYEHIVVTAQQTFQQWCQVPAPKRGELIRLIGDELRLKKDLLGSLVALESGKIKAEGDGEVQEMIDMADMAVGQSRMLYGVTMQSERFRHRMFEQWHPLGVIGVITSFNFPVAVWAWNAFNAAICGDCVIWKPSSKVPLCAIAVQNICHEVMKKLGYEGVFSLFVTDDNQVAEKLVQDTRVPLISFTGSTRVGRQVGENVAKRLGRSILELSGNNAVIIDESADLRLAIPSIVFGAVGTAGQRCTSTRRVIVHQHRYDELKQQLLMAYQQIKIGDPLQPDVLMGPLIDHKAVESYQKALSEVKNSGGEILYGGKVLDRPGFFVEPTLVRAEFQSKIIQKETFGPILYILTFKELSEAIALHNGVSQGLSSAMFTENLRHAEYFLSVLGSDSGIANINIGTSGAEIGGAFGGEKETGGGREAGSDAWKYYMRRQTTTINWSEELPLAQGIKFNIKAESKK